MHGYLEVRTNNSPNPVKYTLILWIVISTLSGCQRKTMRLSVQWMLLLSLSVPVCAQVANDSVHRRIELQVGVSHTSYTAQSTVERNCVDESLTGKCIKYHNDQWFFFRSGDRDKLFVNVSNQHCKDLNGVQLVLLTGEPCHPSSYTLLSCASSGTNDDFYVEANVSPYTTYLLIVDGYLKDFCDFDITLDTIPRGLPPEPNLDLSGDGTLIGKVVRLNWALPDLQQEGVRRFIVYRRNNSSYHFTARDTVAVDWNAFGEIQGEYAYTDTLDDQRAYFYRIAAQAYSDQQYLFAEYSFRWSEVRKKVGLPLHYRNNTPLTVTVRNASRDKVLESHTFTYRKEDAKPWLDLTEYWENGHREVVLEVTDNKKKSESTVVDLTEVGFR